MPKSFSEKEREKITGDLRRAAAESMQRVGIKKTTVDELVKAARIPKGTFYLFYDSKELLLFEVIEQWHDELHTELAARAATLAENTDANSVTELIMSVFREVFATGFYELMVSGELDALIRRLPDSVMREHLKSDEKDMEIIFSLLPETDEHKKRLFSAAMRALFFTVAHKREIGEDIFDDTLRLCLRGLVLQMLEGEK